MFYPIAKPHVMCFYLGLSAQDCVELRRYFRIPPAIQAKTKIVPVTLTYMWNDRDCNEKNFFLCERPLSDGIFHPCKMNERTKKKIEFIIHTYSGILMIYYWFFFLLFLNDSLFHTHTQNRSKSHGQLTVIKPLCYRTIIYVLQYGAQAFQHIIQTKQTASPSLSHRKVSTYPSNLKSLC